MRRFPLLALFGLVVASPAGAQVGNDPATSPYRELRRGRFIEGMAGWMGGDGGEIPVGPRDGFLVGGRIDFRSKNSVQVSLGGWYANTVRNIVDADDSVATRVKEPPISADLYGVEGAVQFNMMGAKTYNGLAPYVAVGFGAVWGEHTPAADTSGYFFDTKAYIVPILGTRYFLAQDVFLKLEYRLYLWKIYYPPSYSFEPADEPGSGLDFNAVNPTRDPSKIIPAPALMFGIGYAF